MAARLSRMDGRRPSSTLNSGDPGLVTLRGLGSGERTIISNASSRLISARLTSSLI